MSVNSIGSSFAAAAQKVSSGSSAKPNAVEAAAQEANESAATTAKEAKNGDVVAQRKLRAIEAKKSHQAPKAPEPGKGAQIDHAA